MDMNRRQLLQTAATGLGTVVLGSLASSYAKAAETLASERTILRLTIREAEAEMVDLTRAYVWVFDDGTPRLPGPVITCTEGDRLDIAVTNELPGQHGFEVPGVVSSGLIGQGQTRLLKFLAPPAGTYIYLDPFNAPLNRVMGLHGVLVSLPRVGNTPYSYPTPSVQQLFDDLGTHEVFPGHPWQREAT
ncbi:MAG: multicopper oxidase domain-containing protein, partial [Planctomycetes bacterium]|nr:multicopper oxidase domain-containing protein [Planctomycetota bacterium]